MLQEVAKGLRPEIPSEAPKRLSELIQACWATDPGARPVFTSITSTLKRINPDSNVDMMDAMTRMLETYASGLEAMVAERTVSTPVRLRRLLLPIRSSSFDSFIAD